MMRALSQNPPSLEAALRALIRLWTTVRAVLVKNSDLRYGSNGALDLFRIANLILLTCRYSSPLPPSASRPQPPVPLERLSPRQASDS
jgi:hypothetical protein